MTKAEFVDSIAGDFESKKAAADAVDAVLDGITDTLTKGADDVVGRTTMGVAVSVGFSAGRSAVAVTVAGSGVGVFSSPTGKPTSAVWVAPEIMVPMTAVSREWISCVGAGILGTTQARETTNKRVTAKRMGVDFFILPPLMTVIRAIGRVLACIQIANNCCPGSCGNRFNL